MSGSWTTTVHAGTTPHEEYFLACFWTVSSVQGVVERCQGETRRVMNLSPLKSRELVVGNLEVRLGERYVIRSCKQRVTTRILGSVEKW